MYLISKVALEIFPCALLITLVLSAFCGEEKRSAPWRTYEVSLIL